MPIIFDNVTFTGGILLSGVSGTPGPTPLSDQYFQYTTLLLDGLGANGAQNNTFLDSSTNNFTITRNGNTTQGSFTPFSHSSGYWSNFFDGSGDSLNTPTSAAFGFGTGNFTVEFWVNFASTTGRRDLVWWGADDNDRGGLIYNQLAGNLTYFISPTVGGAINYAWTPAIGVWYHIALVRISGSSKLYVNGVQVSSTYTDSKNYSAYPVTIGKDNAAASSFFSGYISNMRIVKGTGVYTTNFTPSTTPLTAITNTSLLTCQSNSFKDNSSNNFVITKLGDTAATLFQPFTLSSEYNSSTMGGSMYFDGSGDYLSVPTTNSLMHQIGDWTYEGWAYWNVVPTAGFQNIFGQGAAGQSSYGLTIFNNRFTVNQANGGNRITGTTIVVTGTWYHFALVRSSNVIRLYVNGNLEGSPYTDSGSYGFNGNPFTVGNNSNGYISNFRFNRTAVYTANFTPPTSPVTAITGTQLLLNGTNAGIVDSTGFNDSETVGNAQISTAQSKWGGSSMYFDGSGDYLITPGNPVLNIGGSSTWTIEFWGYIGAAFGTYCPMSMAQTSNIRWGIEMGASTTNVLFSNSLLTSFTNPVTLQPNTWYHFALTRDGTTTRWFVNGQPSVTTTTNNLSSVTATTPMHIGRNNVSGFFFDWNGYMQGVRITNGIARYTGTFTPPTDY